MQLFSDSNNQPFWSLILNEIRRQATNVDKVDGRTSQTWSQSALQTSSFARFWLFPPNKDAANISSTLEEVFTPNTIDFNAGIF